MSAKSLIIIDGSSYFFRAFYAIQRLSTSKGFPTNAIYGFINMVLKVLEVEKPEYLVIAFDTPKPSFRKEMYAEYKSNRSAPPEDLVVQIPHILRAVDAFGIKRLQQEGAEADDVIATLAERAVKDGFKVDIITGDKDLMQLVTSDVTLYDTMKDKRVGPEGVVERFGVNPEQIVDLLALMGDTSDNIPGVSGIGEKTAAELIKTYGSLDGIYASLDSIKQEKRRQTLIAEKEIAYLSRDLATVKRDLELSFDWDEARYGGPHSDKLQAFFEEMEFHGLMKRFQFSATPKEGFQSTYETISTEAKLREVVLELSGAQVISVDTETTSLKIQDAQMVGISLSGQVGKAYYLPLGHRLLESGEPAPGQVASDIARELLRPILENAAIGKIGQNLKYDIQIFRNWGIQLRGIFSDTLLESYLSAPEEPHGLDALALRYLGHQNIAYEDVTGKGKTQISFADVAIDKATAYSAEDADVALRLHQILHPKVKSQGMEKLLFDIEVPLVSVLADLEYTGVKINEPGLENLAENLSVDLAAVEDKIYELGCGAFNINSPKQLSHVLFEKLKLPIIRKTKTGISTDESVLTELKSQHPICEWILRFREFGKLKSTFVDGLIQEIHPTTGRVHTSFNQTVAATGRLSSSNPNLQNIPTASDPRYDLRTMFIAEEGHQLLSADYSQVELRLLADMSGDPALTTAFEKDEDVHEYTARQIFGVDIVTPEHRKVAKTINFGVVYGQTPYGLSQTLKISPAQAKDFIEKYFARYSGVKSYLNGLIALAHEKGYAETKLGRRRPLPGLESKNRMLREMAERAAINTPLQGTAADMIKIAMISLYRELKRRKLKTRMILQVHDELVLEVPDEEKEVAENLLRTAMEKALPLKVPLKVDIGWGKNWRECDG